MRLLVVLHRYLGIVVGAVMVLWCLSGFVMMYQGYPRLEPAQRLEGLEPVKLTPSQARAALDLPDDASLLGFRLEMAGTHPMLQVQRAPGRRQVFDLATGQLLEELPADQAHEVARDFAAGNGIAGPAADLGVIDEDQWTVEGAGRRGPVRRIRFGDAAGTDIYIGQRTGEVAQITTARTRLLAWFGAIPHWLYPEILRRNGALWGQVVVWSSLIGVFLTVIGLYLGIARFKRYKSGRWSPYRGWFYWHHIVGLVFGVLTLTWVASGLFTMNPWGFLDSPAGLAERFALAGKLSGADAKGVLALAPALRRPGLVSLQAAPLGGKLYLMALDKDGGVQRLDADGRPAPLGQAEVAAALKPLGLAWLERQDREDAYYYSGFERKAQLPVWRAALADKAHTTLYIDAGSGRMVDAMDDVGRQSRWLRTGLHDVDFFAALRVRPVWDIVVLLLLAGVTGVCVTGAWLGIKRIGRDAAAVRRWAGGLARR